MANKLTPKLWCFKTIAMSLWFKYVQMLCV